MCKVTSITHNVLTIIVTVVCRERATFAIRRARILYIRATRECTRMQFLGNSQTDLNTVVTQKSSDGRKFLFRVEAMRESEADARRQERGVLS